MEDCFRAEMVARKRELEWKQEIKESFENQNNQNMKG
jgi:hypothetical protein